MHIFKWRVALLALSFVLNGNFISLINDYRVAPEYSRQLNERYALIAEQKTKGNLDVIVPELTVNPELIFSVDISESEFDWRNTSYAGYFGLDSVRVLPTSLISTATEGNPEKELVKAIELAEGGDVSLQYYLGQLYDHTVKYPEIVVSKDSYLASEWYIKAAENGHKTAQRLTGAWLYRGWGTPDGKPDYLGAAKWYLKWLFW